jgi:octaprenyl-diphosphate synthase
MTPCTTQQLKLAFQAELPAIHAAIHEEIARLPQAVQPVARHVLDAGGKRLRPMLTILTARALGGAEVHLHATAVALELLHSATLIHDDILDGATTRRGRPAAHTVFGLVPAILAGDALLAHANAIMARPGIPALTTCAAQAILATAAGEIEEIAAMDAPALSQEAYLEIITGKTAYLIQAACEAGAILARADAAVVDAARRFGLGLGIAFQLVDDALDYAATEAALGKPQGGDLREGKRTLPLLLFLESLPDNERGELADRIQRRELSAADFADIQQRVVDGGFARATVEKAQAYVHSALSALSLFPESPEREILHTIGEYVLKREK